MFYVVDTEWKPLNVRAGPGLRFRVVAQLPRGFRVIVLETIEGEEGIWHRLWNGWVSWLYLEPVSAPTPDPDLRRRPLPHNLQFNPELGRLRDHLRSLRRRLQETEEHFNTQAQAAAQHGSRLYEIDSESRFWRQVESIPRIVDGPPEPGMTSIENYHESVIRRELEESARRYQREAQRIRNEIDRAERELRRERLRTFRESNWSG